MEKLDQKIKFQDMTIHSFLQNLNYNSIEEMEIGLRTILGRKHMFTKEQWNLIIDMIIKNLQDSKEGLL